MNSIQVWNGMDWHKVAEFSAEVSLDLVTNMATDIAFDMEYAIDVAVISGETGEILWSASDHDDIEDIYSEPPDIDDDCGYDPYEGCYTGDC